MNNLKKVLKTFVACSSTSAKLSSELNSFDAVDPSGSRNCIRVVLLEKKCTIEKNWQCLTKFDINQMIDFRSFFFPADGSKYSLTVNEWCIDMQRQTRKTILVLLFVWAKKKFKKKTNHRRQTTNVVITLSIDVIISLFLKF